jgi:uncharacterized protein YeaO (DUF488 family)
MLYTSYYWNVRNLTNVITVSISLKTPILVDFYLPELAPNWSILSAIKKTGDKEEYTRRFKEEILGVLDPTEIIGKLRRISIMSGRKDVVMLCFENKKDFCHRHLVSKWLRDAGYSIEEI